MDFLGRSISSLNCLCIGLKEAGFPFGTIKVGCQVASGQTFWLILSIGWKLDSLLGCFRLNFVTKNKELLLIFTCCYSIAKTANLLKCHFNGFLSIPTISLHIYLLYSPKSIQLYCYESVFEPDFKPLLILNP